MEDREQRGRSSRDADASTSDGKRRRDSGDSQNSTKPTLKKHAGDRKDGKGARNRRDYMPIIDIRPHDHPTKNENQSNEVKLTANYFRLAKSPTWNIYKYCVAFEPECMMARLRKFLIDQHRDKLGGYLFDGTQLFLTKKLDDDTDSPIVWESKTRQDEKFNLIIKFTKVVMMTEDESLQILNLILRRTSQNLNLQVVNRNYFDPAAKIDLHQFHIQLWPGYQTSIRKYEHDILVNCDIVHKVMRTDTVHHLMTETLKMDPRNFNKSFKEKVLGLTVLTDYNNKTYRIDDVEFEKNPKSTFMMKDREVTILEYYQSRYNIKIKDENQPLLVTMPKEKSRRGGDVKPALLVPELCRMTGLSERQRTDISLKNAMKPYSQMVPRTRIERLLTFNRRVSCEANQKIFNDFNTRLENKLVEFTGHMINQEVLAFGNGRTHTVMNAGWDRECGRAPLLKSIDLKRWYVVFPKFMEREANKFVSRMIDLSRNMGFNVTKPRFQLVDNERRIAQEVERLVNAGNPQMIFFAVSSNNSDTYSSIKKACYENHPIASQVVTKKLLTREKDFDSIVTKVAIQMCTKLGGAPWLPSKIPIPRAMTIGFDVTRDTVDKKKAYGCLVATMDLKEGAEFYSTVSEHNDADKLSKDFAISVNKALRAFYQQHKSLPTRIFIYRGGVGEGDIQHVRDVEIKALEELLTKTYEKHGAKDDQGNPIQKLQIVFIVVSKRVNTRIFAGENNPRPGTVVDEVITLAERYEFFLVSQQANQGSISPTNYNIIYDTVNPKAEQIQVWTFKHTHLYYNWFGTTRVPSVLQYATKLAFLVSNYMHCVSSTELEKNLFYL